MIKKKKRTTGYSEVDTKIRGKKKKRLLTAITSPNDGMPDNTDGLKLPEV